MKDALGHGSNGFFGGVVKPLWHAFVTNEDAASALSSGQKSARVLVHQAMRDRGWQRDNSNDLGERNRRLARALM
jgi:hypothetical protein